MQKIISIDKKIKTKQAGFTLLEMLIAVSLFVIIAFISMGAMVSIFGANRKAQSLKTVVDNLNLSLEDMARTIRFGGGYHCGSTGQLSNPRNCTSGDTFIAVQFGGETVIYRLDNNAIQKSYSNGSGYRNITSSDTVIEHLSFYVFGSSDSDIVQPYVIAVIKGRVGNQSSTQTSFSIQTQMSQRTLDIDR